jgi:aminopeptidase N
MYAFICNFAVMFSYKLSSGIAFGVIILLGSCTISRKSTKPVPITMPEIQVSSNDPLDIYRATATKEWELIHTDIDIRFNLKQRSADAVTQISLHPYFYATDSVVLDAKGMQIVEVTDNRNNKLPYRYDTLHLSIKLPKVFSQKDTLKLNIKYTALPYAFDVGGSKAITEDRGLYFINADGAEPYQQVQIWTQGETEASSRWFPTFDKSNFRSTFQITMHVPDSFKTLSNGKLSSSVKEKDGMRADTWNQDIPIPSYLVMMAASNFAVAKESWRGKEVSYYVPQEYGAYAKDIFNNTPEMIEFFSNKLGVPFPWDKYSQVVGYDYVSGAMENVSASLFGAFNLKDRRQLADEKNDFIIVHELFHQWFGDYVTAESWSNLTLNESFADYSEHLWMEHKYGEDARAVVWMQGLNKYLNQAKWSDPPLVRFHYKSQEDMFDRVTYSKGGLILHYLRQLTGDKAFFDALHLYLTQNALHSAEATQLRLAFEQVTGKDWNWFFDQWYYHGGHPKLEVSYNYNDTEQKVTVTILQKQSDSTGLYRLPMKAKIITSNNVNEVDWNIEKKKEEYVYNYVQGQRPVIVPDAEHWMPGEITDKKSAGQWLIQYRNSNDYLNKRLALEGVEELKNNDTAEQIFYLALKDKDPVLRRLAINVKEYAGNKKLSKEWISSIGKIAEADNDNAPKAAALNALGDLGNEEYISTYEKNISDSSYNVAAAALYALDRVNHKRAVEYARNFDLPKMLGNALLYKASGIIAKDGKKEDCDFFEQKTWQLFETNRMTFLNTVQDYLTHVDDITAFSRGIALLQKLALKNPDAYSGFYAGAIIYNLKAYADKSIKVATDKAMIDDWKTKKDVAIKAWQIYKSTVKDEDLKLEIARMEKE